MHEAEQFDELSELGFVDFAHTVAFLKEMDMRFGSMGDVDDWLTKPGNTVNQLRALVETNRMDIRNVAAATEWLLDHDAKVDAARTKVLDDREERVVRAAEKSALWAFGAAAISLAALALAAWPYIKEHLVN